jgi:hypothetical protein
LPHWTGQESYSFYWPPLFTRCRGRLLLKFSEEFLELQTGLQFLLGQGPMRFMVAGNGAALKVNFVRSSRDLIMCEYK